MSQHPKIVGNLNDDPGLIFIMKDGDRFLIEDPDSSNNDVVVRCIQDSSGKILVGHDPHNKQVTHGIVFMIKDGMSDTKSLYYAIKEKSYIYHKIFNQLLTFQRKPHTIELWGFCFKEQT